MSATSSSRRAALAVTQGDPRGIGPELILRACAAGKLVPGDRVFARRDVLEAAGRGGEPWAASGLERATSLLVGPEVFGRSSGPRDPTSQVEALEAAVSALDTTTFGGLVTAPIEKLACQRAGFGFPGHTEYLATSSGVDSFAMCLVGPTLRVALVTIHVPLREVADRVSTVGVAAVGRLLGAALQRWFGVASPRVGVLGLNPHAGEGGMLGVEDAEIIAPAVEELSRWGSGRNIVFEGPLPADTAFPRHQAGDFDGVVAMYHDQGLGPFKLAHFHDGVNLTLGLPYVRTSPDHGTAFDIAGTGLANPSSMFAAIDLARSLASRAGYAD